LSSARHNSSEMPQMPFIIAGKVNIVGSESTDKDDYYVILKSDNKVNQSRRVELKKQNEYSYILVVQEKLDSEKPLDLYVRIGNKEQKVSTIQPGLPGEIIKLNIKAQKSPQENILHQNYPNPFNPDTWIPYELNKESEVEIGIYGSNGQLVRRLDLGRKAPGFYTGKEQAGYWDGKNEAGENVVSGVYFYTIKAGEFISTRKMVILK
jgi:hypothetical protein